MRTLFYFYITLFYFAGNKTHANNRDISQRSAFYFSVNGDDKNDGSLLHPFRSIAFLNTIVLHAGDTVFLKGGEIFNGNFILHSNASGNNENPIVITSYGIGNSIINAGNASAITIDHSKYLHVKNITCKGAGRKEGNTKEGISISDCSNIYFENIDVSGFQKSGLQLYCCENVNVDRVYAHDNGFAGIYIIGNGVKTSCSNITVTNCTARNNPGDPTELNNHSGNGILAGYCKNILIDHCVATNNGWDMPRKGNGPVGIWCYEADSVIIQHCISYKNKTSAGGEDGGGYDLDGGVTNSIIQYCLSYENQGSAFGIFQYAGASNWHDNTIRYCISENDGSISSAHAGIYIWNSSNDSAQFKNMLFYNNTIYNSKNAAISYAAESAHSNFCFYNNIFIGADELIIGKEAPDVFVANNWWSLQKRFNINGNNDFRDWATKNHKEQVNGEIKGLNVLPGFKNAGNTNLTDVSQLDGFDDYAIIGLSPVTRAGLDLQGLFNINTGGLDFNGQPGQRNFLGACDHQLK